MKKFALLALILVSSLNCGCSKIHEIENNRIITACLAVKDGENIRYGFFVSVPAGSEGGEDSGSESVSKIYEYSARNFSEALSHFEDSGIEKTDTSHISLFAANIDYYNDMFKKDEKYIRERIPAMPLVYTCVIDDDYNDLTECINTEYSSKAEDFSKNIFESQNSKLNCTLTELSLSVYNENHTSVIPVLKISERGEGIMPEIISVGFYHSNKDITMLTNDEYKTFVSWQEKHSAESRGYKLSVPDRNLIVKTDDKNIAILADKYIKNDVDMLNVKYYCKKCFLTYEEYDRFIKELNYSNNIIFEA